MDVKIEELSRQFQNGQSQGYALPDAKIYLKGRFFMIVKNQPDRQIDQNIK